MKKLRIIKTEATLTTHLATGSLGLGGTFLIIDSIKFRGDECYVIKDWDGEGEDTYIVTKEAANNKDDVRTVGYVRENSLDRWLTHPDQVPESRKAIK